MEQRRWLRILLVAVSCLQEIDGREVTVVRFQTDGIQTVESYLDTGPGFLPNLTQVSVCFHLKMYHATHSVIPFVSYFGGGNDNELLICYKWNDKTLDVYCCNNTVIMKFPLMLSLYEWHHLCLSLDLVNSTASLFFNDDQMMERPLMIDHSYGRDDYGTRIVGGGRLVVGQDLDKLEGNFDYSQSFDGEVADLRLYDTILNSADFRKFISCTLNDTTPLGVPVISLNDGGFQLKGPTENSTISEAKLCQKADAFYILFLEQLDFQNSVNMCKKFKTSLALPEDDKQNKNIFSKFEIYSPQCEGVYKALYWVGAKGHYASGKWFQLSDGEPLQWHNMPLTLSKVTENENCIVASGTEFPYVWWRAPCEDEVKTCPLCTSTSYPRLRLRGLCRSSLLDRSLYLRDYRNGQPMMDGEYHTRIEWDDDSWVMRSRKYKDLKATLFVDSPEDFPIGLHNWTIDGDKCDGKEMSLLVTACNEREYTCKDGSCISKTNNCDGKLDCPDQSDELDCGHVLPPKGYSEEIMAPRSTTKPLNFSFDINITSIPEFGLVSFTMAIDAIWRLKWQDSRLTYKNLGADYKSNKVKDFQNLLWTPVLKVTDATKSLVDTDEASGALFIQRVTEPLKDNYEIIAEDEMYSGQENLLVYENQQTFKFHCHFKLHMYPFDHQFCSLSFTLKDVPSFSGILTKDGSGVTLEGDRELLEYKLESETMTVLDEGGVSVIKVKLELRNQYRYYISSAFIPSFLIVLLSVLTLYFDVNDFPDRVMVTLTCMLVLAAFFTQTSHSIPKTSYLKLIDLWYMILICEVFLIIVGHILIENLRVKQQNRQSGLTQVVPFKTFTSGKVLTTQEQPRVSKAGIANKYLLVIFHISILIILAVFIIIALCALNEDTHKKDE